MNAIHETKFITVLVSDDLPQDSKKLQHKINQLLFGVFITGIGADGQKPYNDNYFITLADKNLFL